MQYSASGQNSWLHRYERRLALKGFRAEYAPFSYTFPFTNPVAAGATVSATITTDRDSDFFVLAPMVNVTLDDVGRTAVPAPGHNFQLKMETTGRNLDDRALQVGNFFGDAERPYRLAVPLVIPGRSSITMTLTNETNVAHRVFYTLQGVKAFILEAGGPALEDLRQELGLRGSSRFAESVDRVRRA